MNTKQCVVWCVGIVSGLLFFVALMFGIIGSDLTEALSEPAQSSRVEIAHMIITNPNDGTTIEINDFDAMINSRIIDFITGIVAMEGR